MEVFYQYLDDLLALQSRAADRHNHSGVLGAVREEFIKTILRERVDGIEKYIHTGEVLVGNKILGQQDIIIRKKGTINTQVGGQVRLGAAQCDAVIEIKSNVKLTEISDFDEKASKIKSENEKAVCGMVLYKINGRKETVLKRSGFNFDKEIQSFVPEIQSQYKSIDFILSLDGETEECGRDYHGNPIKYDKAFFLRTSHHGYNLFLLPPFTKYFLHEINAIYHAQDA